MQRILVSGGQGTNEPCSEAEGMAEYLLNKGIEEDRIILEDRSTNTVEKGVYGIAADSNVLYLPNNVLRECCGILKDWIMKNI